MDKIQLSNNTIPNVTVLSNDFIDRYMVKAEGEYVKIFLLLLRLQGGKEAVTIDLLADRLDLTRKDVSRALRYWQNEGLIASGLEETAMAEDVPVWSDTVITESTDQNPAIPPAIERSPLDLTALTEYGPLHDTIFMIQTYLGKTLTVKELNTLCYIEQELGFTPELLDYLIEFCIGREKKTLRYIESVAIDWYQEGIDTIEKAREYAARYKKNVFAVLKAFGLSSRNPAPKELDFINQWNDMGFETDLIVEACNRSINATHQPSFQYAHSILTNWFTNGVTSMKDVEAMDKAFQEQTGKKGQYPEGTNKTAYKQDGSSKRGYKPDSSSKTGYKSDVKEGRPIKHPKPNAFHNFEQDTYDYDEITAKLLARNRRP